MANFDEDEESVMSAARMNMDDEYEGGQWIDGEFYYNRKREKRVQSKEDAIYGVFSDSFGRSNKSSQGYAAADSVLTGGSVKFVSTGIIEPSKEEDKKAAETHKPIQQEKKATPVDVRKVIDRDFGKFEKHTKGFGMKMLMKMGFKGRLGKNADGLVNPVLPKMRPKGMGMSFNNFKEKNDSESFRNAAEEAAAQSSVKNIKSETDEIVYESREMNWKKGAGGKAKVVYKTANQLTASINNTTVSDKYQIVDMRGPNIKVNILWLHIR